MAILYFNPSTINLPAVGETFDVEVKVRDVTELYNVKIAFTFDGGSDTLGTGRSLEAVDLNLVQNALNSGAPSAYYQSVLGKWIVEFGFNASSGGLPNLITAESEGEVLATVTFRVVVRRASSFEFTPVSGVRGLRTSIWNRRLERISIDSLESASLQAGSMPPPDPDPPDPDPDPPISYSGQTLPSNWKVFLGDVDISTSVADISNIDTALDVENPLEFVINDARIQVNSPFPSGLVNGSLVDIFAGSKKIFSGNIKSIDKDVKQHTADVVINDISRSMRDEDLKDFGIYKRVRVTKVGDTDSGEYPFTNVLSPVSEDSVINPRSDGTPLNVVKNLITEGNLEPTNISYDEETLRSEGESLENNPDVTLKAPYRHKTIDYIVNKILDFYSIENSIILQDAFEVNDHFSTNGRVGYDLENNLDINNPLAQGTETAIFWTGRVTDFIVDDDKWYFLYSSRINNPSIIRYDPLTDEYKELYKRSSHAEWWKFVKSGDTFYLLGTTISSVDAGNPTRGAYDPTEHTSGLPSGTFIEKLRIQHLDDPNVDNINTLSNLLSNSPSHALRAVVGMYYQMGFAIDGQNNNVRQGIQPDTRNSFILRNGYIYYPFANNIASGRFGIARINISNSNAEIVVGLPRDDYFNHLGLAFTIHGNQVIGVAVFQTQTNSSRIIFRKAV